MTESIPEYDYNLDCSCSCSECQAGHHSRCEFGICWIEHDDTIEEDHL